jgi:hypothetical protein
MYIVGCKNGIKTKIKTLYRSYCIHIIQRFLGELSVGLCYAAVWSIIPLLSATVCLGAIIQMAQALQKPAPAETISIDWRFFKEGGSVSWPNLIFI